VNVPGLQQSVVDGIPRIFPVWEGNRLPYMYCDERGIVTCATGNALFSAAAADALAWYHPADGSPCSKAEVDAAYEVVKSAFPGVQSTACSRLTTIRLTQDAMTSLIDRTIAEDWGYLAKQFPGCDAWPADAQLMLLSSAWAWGAYFCNVWDRISARPGADADAGEFVPQPGFGYGAKFKSLLSAPPQFVLAAQVMRDVSAHEEQINPGIVPRDLAEVVMLENAGAVAAAAGDFSKLWYPAGWAA